MSKKYSKNEIIEMCQKALDEDVSLFYTKGFVNYVGTVRDDKSLYYTEVVAEFILNHIDSFKAIKPIGRRSSYKINHEGKCDENTNRIEEKIAMEMFCQTNNGNNMNYLGKIVDYQTPLKAVRTDKAGKIDLLAETDDEVYVLELKREDSNETMLRCVLEGYTYLRTINKEQLMHDFNISPTKSFYAAPIVFRKGSQWKEMQEPEKHPYLIKLMRELDVKGPFYIVRESIYNIVLN